MGESEYTLAERHEIYKAALEIFRPHPFIGLCYALCLSCDKHSDEYHGLIRWGFLPEFIAQKPEGAIEHQFWWPIYNLDIRIQVLQNCINQTKPLL